MSFEQQAMREHGYQVGRDNPEREWILTPLDSWECNAFYAGKPGRHPEDDCDYSDEATETCYAGVTLPIHECPF